MLGQKYGLPSQKCSMSAFLGRGLWVLLVNKFHYRKLFINERAHQPLVDSRTIDYNNICTEHWISNMAYRHATWYRLPVSNTDFSGFEMIRPYSTLIRTLAKFMETLFLTTFCPCMCHKTAAQWNKRLLLVTR